MNVAPASTTVSRLVSLSICGLVTLHFAASALHDHGTALAGATVAPPAREKTPRRLEVDHVMLEIISAADDETVARHSPAVFRQDTEWVLEITFDRGRQGVTRDLRPALPLLCHL